MDSLRPSHFPKAKERCGREKDPPTFYAYLVSDLWFCFDLLGETVCCFSLLHPPKVIFCRGVNSNQELSKANRPELTFD